jgi:hypothetical protein
LIVAHGISKGEVFASFELRAPHCLTVDNDPVEVTTYGIPKNEESNEPNLTTDLSNSQHCDLAPASNSYDNNESYVVGDVVAALGHRIRNFTICSKDRCINNRALREVCSRDTAALHGAGALCNVVHLEGEEEDPNGAGDA